MKGINRDLPDHLIVRYLSGKASESEVAELEARLVAEPEVRAAFLRHARMDAALAGTTRPSLASLPSSPSLRPRILSRGAFAAAAGIALLAAIGLTWWLRPEGIQAEVLAASGRAGEEFRRGEIIRLETLKLVHGELRIRLGSGVTIDFSGPMEARFPDESHAILHAGSLTADVGNTETGFVIETLNTRVVDLGTRFGVTLHDNGDTDVVVLDGAVEVYESGSLSGRERRDLIAQLEEGDAIRVDSKYVTRRLAAVALRGGSLAILDAGSLREAVVTNVTDDNRAADFHRFYSLLPNGMEPGARAYSTLGKPRWLAMPGETFPEELRGADVVGTFSRDRGDQNLNLTLQIAKPAFVFVMLDSRAPVPDWLQRDFESTSLRLRCGPWGDSQAVADLSPAADGEKYVTYRVWRREIAEAGPVTLGPPAPVVRPHRLAMYGIAVREKD